MRVFSSTPHEMIASFWRNRVLIATLIKRDVSSRYRGSMLGLLWSFFQPVLMLAIYTFVFSVVFKARWNVGSDSKTEFALVLFAGLIVFNLFSECISRSPTLILSHANYVKKVVFPLEILPWVSLGTALFQMLMSFSVWFLFYMLLFGLPHSTLLLFPLTILPIVLITMGLSWMLASIGVYLRDVGQIIGIVITILMFLSPIFYPVTSLPVEYQSVIRLNPLTPVIENVRDILFWGHIPQLKIYFLYTSFSILLAWSGFAWFQKTRKGFADVL
ncbi:ABC transporter permease [Legionella lytica]|uniref:Transport permease protein n=1 Tax=Legionella lytica TaxID=96232 RepID=A0ABW8D8W0_9GAMM